MALGGPRLTVCAARISAVLVLGTLLALPLAGQDSTVEVTGVVIARDGNTPLPFATIALDSSALSWFTDSNGVFRLHAVPLGKHRIRARELGFAPEETNVDITPDLQSVSVTIALRRVPHALPRVSVGDRLRCLHPGFPDSAASPALAAVAEALAANAERMSLLNKQQPYDYSIEAHLVYRFRDHPELDRDEVDTLEFRTNERRPYRPGGIEDTWFVGRRPMNGYEGPYIYLPDVEDFSLPAFTNHHCFRYGGVDSTTGTPELRIDFSPLDKMRDADAEGSVFLDPERLVIRRSTIRMTRGEHLVPPIRRFETSTWFRELVPYVVVEDSSRTLQTEWSPRSGQADATEEQRVIDYHPLPKRHAKS
jgi:hypothetical protein